MNFRRTPGSLIYKKHDGEWSEGDLDCAVQCVTSIVDADYDSVAQEFIADKRKYPDERPSNAVRVAGNWEDTPEIPSLGLVLRVLRKMTYWDWELFRIPISISVREFAIRSKSFYYACAVFTEKTVADLTVAHLTAIRGGEVWDYLDDEILDRRVLQAFVPDSDPNIFERCLSAKNN